MRARWYWLLILLTAGSASTDALSYLGLGRVFPANMTGNTVLLAVDTARGDDSSAARSAVALGGFVCGAVLAGLATRPARHWTGAMRCVLLGEFGVQVAVLSWWLTLPAPPSGGTRFGLIAMLGMTMGGQSALVARLPVTVSTIYITGTWTGVSLWAAGRLRAARNDGEQSDALLHAAVVGCYFASAIGAAYLFKAAQGAVAAIPAGLVAIVSLALSRRAHVTDAGKFRALTRAATQVRHYRQT